MKQTAVRIIGGKYRKRNITFSDTKGLRPTPNRLRETVFNWLQFDIATSHVLDLFAGSGALGFEALSRGARQVIFVDSCHQSYHNLSLNKTTLGCQNVSIVHQDALAYLNQATQAFDVVFLDPPFHQDYLAKTIALLYQKNLVKKKGSVYLESEDKIATDILPENWHIVNHKKVSSVYGCLVRVGG